MVGPVETGETLRVFGGRIQRCRIVDFNDLVSMLFEFGAPDANPGCDADGNEAIDFNDLVAALFLFGPCL